MKKRKNDFIKTTLQKKRAQLNRIKFDPDDATPPGRIRKLEKQIGRLEMIMKEKQACT